MAPDLPADLYVSGDIEADGPIPGQYSMLSFGLCLAGRFDGREFQALDPGAQTFYAELQPISERFDPEAVRVSRLNREELKRKGRAPRDAMTEAARWVRKAAGDDRTVFVGFPVVFDWMFLYWYFVAFADGGSPFDFSAVLDMKTMFQQKARVVTAAAGLSDLPAELDSRRPHTHNALDDALRQAEIFARLFLWGGRAAP
ncbi:MAG TPA: 3'-5' exoribonuclease [Gaiellaceae bacterium]